MSKNVKIIIGNIEEQTTQTIVNPTNESMLWEDKTCNGLIMKKYGNNLVTKCQDFVTKNGSLKMNDIFVYEINDSKIETKFVLNIYPPFWQPAVSSYENIENLYDCYYNCFKSCIENNRIDSISFPLIGSGTFGFPIQASYKLLENVIRDNNYSMFKEIRIVFWTREQFELCNKIIEI